MNKTERIEMRRPARIRLIATCGAALLVLTISAGPIARSALFGLQVSGASLPPGQSQAYEFSERVISSFGTAVELVSVLSFFLIVAFAQARPKETGASEIRAGGMLRGWLVTLLLAMVAVATTIVIANPRGYYGTSFFSPRLEQSRTIKAEYMGELDAAPQVVVLGPSVALSVSPAHIEETLGYDAFNMSVTAGDMEEYVLQSRYIAARFGDDFPEVLLVQVPLLQNPERTATRQPPRMLPFMSPSLLKDYARVRLEGLFELQQFSEAVYVLRFTQIHGTIPANQGLWQFGPPNGEPVERTYPENLEQTLANAMSQTPPHCSELPRTFENETTKLVALAEEYNSSIVFYMTPFHPQYYEAVATKDQGFVHCRRLYAEYVDGLVRTRDNIYFLDYSLLESFNGLDTAEGYFDQTHLTTTNSNLMIDAMADTINAAYDSAAARRAAGQ